MGWCLSWWRNGGSLATKERDCRIATLSQERPLTMCSLLLALIVLMSLGNPKRPPPPSSTFRFTGTQTNKLMTWTMPPFRLVTPRVANGSGGYITSSAKQNYAFSLPSLTYCSITILPSLQLRVIYTRKPIYSPI